MGETGGAPDEDHGDDEKSNDTKPNAQRAKVARRHGGRFHRPFQAVSNGRIHGSGDSGLRPSTQSGAPCPIAAVRGRFP
jgi:hypothetical protein